MTETPLMLTIQKIIKENSTTKTLVFKHNLNAIPGQFVNVWIPGVDEKPYSVSYQDKEKFAITIAAVGKFSSQLNKLKVGDKLGIRGPYGRGFSLCGKRIVIVGGGCGSAPLSFLANKALQKKKKVTFIMGARNKSNLMFIDRMKKAKANVLVCTDDGSVGEKGFTTDLLKKVLEKEKVDMVYTCGPEIMMKKVVDLCKNVKCEVSMERYMKCGFGVCGQCVCGKKLVCKDGPVFNAKEIRNNPDFGNFARTKSGKKVNLKDYHCR